MLKRQIPSVSNKGPFITSSAYYMDMQELNKFTQLILAQCFEKKAYCQTALIDTQRAFDSLISYIKLKRASLLSVLTITNMLRCSENKLFQVKHNEEFSFFYKTHAEAP